MTTPPAADRDGQRRSAFALILERLVHSCLGCIAAVLVDEEGEAVDYAGDLPAYEAKLAGAHWQIVLRELSECARAHTTAAGTPRSVEVRTAARGYYLRQVFGGYVLIVVAVPQLLPALSRRALSQVEHELRDEAGWPARDDAEPPWLRVSVSCDQAGRPRLVRCGHAAVERVSTIGPLDGLAVFERGFRACADDARELELVREPTGFWYARERPR